MSTIPTGLCRIRVILSRYITICLLVLISTPLHAGMDLRDAIKTAFSGNYEYQQVLDKVKNQTCHWMSHVPLFEHISMLH